MRRRLNKTTRSSTPFKSLKSSSSQSIRLTSTFPNIYFHKFYSFFLSLFKGFLIGFTLAFLFWILLWLRQSIRHNHSYHQQSVQKISINDQVIIQDVEDSFDDEKCEQDGGGEMRERYLSGDHHQCGKGLLYRNATGFMLHIGGEGILTISKVSFGGDAWFEYQKKSDVDEKDARESFVMYEVDGLNRGKYIVERGVCRFEIELVGKVNVVVNGGFEQGVEFDTRGEPIPVEGGLYATRALGYVKGARGWEGWYNGGGKIVCGIVKAAEGMFVAPRSGRCMMRMGWPRQWGFGTADHVQIYYGVHQAIELVSLKWTLVPLLVGVWTYILPPSWSPPTRNVSSNSSLVLAWRYADGSTAENFTIHLPTSNNWVYTCAVIRPPATRPLDMLHIFLHATGTHTRAFFDDITVTSIEKLNKQDNFDTSSCYTVQIPEQTPPASTQNLKRNTHDTHLQREEPVQSNALTIAVAITGDRIGRLERLARTYRGPIVASVLIGNENELKRFIYIWKRMFFLRKWTTIQFIYEPTVKKNNRIPINAMRNSAVSMVKTQYLVVLDVDMIPSEQGWQCFHTKKNKILNKLLDKKKDKRGLIIPVFIVDIGLQLPKWKNDLITALHARVASPYCWNSQKAGRTDRWYAAEEGYEVRFGKDFEPYVILRKEDWIPYDERFEGYGLNKVSWAWEFEKMGGRLFVFHNAFLTHMNHLDNDWVDQIDDHEYLKTWRRYFAMTTEVDAKHSVAGMNDKV